MAKATKSVKPSPPPQDSSTSSFTPSDIELIAAYEQARGPSCETCLAYKKLTPLAGQCHFYPPAIISPSPTDHIRPEGTLGRFPLVMADWSCRQHTSLPIQKA